MNPNQRNKAVVLFAVLAVPGLSFGALIDRGGGLIYDTDLNVTWLADANYAMTSGYAAYGRMTWAAANTWAANLTYNDSVRGVTYGDWRLPTTLVPDASCADIFTTPPSARGFFCSGSEMGHLFYDELGGEAGQHISTTHNANYNLFINMTGNTYWSSTDYALDTSCCAWYFYLATGFQDDRPKGDPIFALAVRDGDVASVPIPAAAMLFSSGLLGLISIARRQIS